MGAHKTKKNRRSKENFPAGFEILTSAQSTTEVHGISEISLVPSIPICSEISHSLLTRIDLTYSLMKYYVIASTSGFFCVVHTNNILQFTNLYELYTTSPDLMHDTDYRCTSKALVFENSVNLEFNGL